MHMLVGVQVRRIAPGHVAECRELARNLVLYGLAVANPAHLIERCPRAVAQSPCAEIEVQTEAQSGTRPGELDRLGGGLVSDHQAGAGHDPASMGLDNAAVDARALAEVIGIHHENTPAGHGYRPKLSSTLASTASALKYCPGMAPAARLWRS